MRANIKVMEFSLEEFDQICRLTNRLTERRRGLSRQDWRKAPHCHIKTLKERVEDALKEAEKELNALAASESDESVVETAVQNKLYKLKFTRNHLRLLQEAFGNGIRLIDEKILPEYDARQTSGALKPEVVKEYKERASKSKVSMKSVLDKVEAAL